MGLGKISRMTGLDPAFPFFELQGSEGRIDKSDAEFVQIVHTNSGFLWEGCLSFKEPLGHVDFYPGGGAHQPGCMTFVSLIATIKQLLTSSREDAAMEELMITWQKVFWDLLEMTNLLVVNVHLGRISRLEIAVIIQLQKWRVGRLKS